MPLLSRKRTLAGLAIFALAACTTILLEISSETECLRSRYTKFRIAKLDSAIRASRLDRGAIPSDLNELLRTGASALAPYASERDLRDAWLRDFYYRRTDDGAAYVLFSLGKDGVIGGEGEDADIGIRGASSDD
ncbi:MAG: type II secretion system protein GspG [Xanthomonadaceae bacterium]|nr:type II secretion system protein GspG [Xanthomonadaceae bacterium]